MPVIAISSMSGLLFSSTFTSSSFWSVVSQLVSTKLQRERPSLGRPSGSTPLAIGRTGNEHQQVPKQEAPADSLETETERRRPVGETVVFESSVASSSYLPMLRLLSSLACTLSTGNITSSISTLPLRFASRVRFPFCPFTLFPLCHTFLASPGCTLPHSHSHFLHLLFLLQHIFPSTIIFILSR